MVIINIFPEKEERKKAIISYKYTAHTIFHDKYAGKDFLLTKIMSLKAHLKL